MKPTNPNFGSNFSDNMDQLNENQVNMRMQFMKYASGGRKQYDLSEEKDKTQIIIDGIKPIRTQQSQVSGVGGIDNAFAKKGQIINDLRSQFDKIKNIRVNTNARKVQQKMSSSDSESSRSRPNDDPSSSSISVSKANKKDTNIRQQRLWQVQRKQFEYMLNNCQQKIEQLLHNEMQYKKMIHQLRSTSFLYKPQQVDTKSDEQLKSLQKQLREQKQKNYKVSSQLQKLKISSKQQLDKLTKIQSENSYRMKDQNKLYDERRRLQENVRLEKDRYLNSQIDKRKYQMENQLLVKEKQQQAVRVQKQIEHLNAMHELNIQSLVKKYQQQIEIKDRRYMLLLSEYEKLKKQYAYTKAQAEKATTNANNSNNNNNSNSNVMFEILKKLIQEKRKNNPNEELTRTVKDLMERFKPSDDDDDDYEDKKKWRYPQSPRSNGQSDHSQATQKLLSEIRMLKAQIEALRNTGDGIDLEPMKRMYEAEIAALKDTIAILERKLKNVPKQDSPNSQKQDLNSPTKQNRQIDRLQRRIRQLQQSSQLRPQKSFSMQQHEQQVLKLKQKIEQVDSQLRSQRRNRSELQFEVTKLRKQLQFRTNIMVNENESKLRIKQQEIQRANMNIRQWRQEFENMKNFYELKLREKNQLLQSQLNKAPLQQVRKNYEQSMEQAKSQYQRQIRAITERLSNYNKQSLDYDALLKRYTSLQAAYYDLQKNVFRSKQINDGVDHLWQIKETQYGNVYEILRQLGQVKGISTGNAQIQGAIYGNYNSAFGQGTTYIPSGQQVIISQPLVYATQPSMIVNKPILISQPQTVMTQSLVPQNQLIYSSVGSQPVNPASVQLNQPIMRSQSQYGVVAPGSPPTLPVALNRALSSQSGPFANVQSATLRASQSQNQNQNSAGQFNNQVMNQVLNAFGGNYASSTNTNAGQANLQRPTSIMGGPNVTQPQRYSSNSNAYLDTNMANRQSNAVYA